jgi:hypothetical protein
MTQFWDVLRSRSIWRPSGAPPQIVLVLRRRPRRRLLKRRTPTSIGTMPKIVLVLESIL